MQIVYLYILKKRHDTGPSMSLERHCVIVLYVVDIVSIVFTATEYLRMDKATTEEYHHFPFNFKFLYFF